MSNTVSKVSIRGRNGTINEDKVSIQVHEAEMAQQEDDPHGLLAHGPQRTSKKNDPHGLLMKESNMTRKKETPTGTTTAEDTKSTYAHADNPPRATLG